MGHKRVHLSAESFGDMSKTIESKVKGFEGTVTLKDPLYIDDVFAIEDALDKSSMVESSSFWTKINETLDNRNEKGEVVKIAWSSRTDKIFLSAIFQCAELFHIANLPEKPALEAFPMTPRARVSEFIKLLWDELQTIYNGTQDIPNES